MATEDFIMSLIERDDRYRRWSAVGYQFESREDGCLRTLEQRRRAMPNILVLNREHFPSLEIAESPIEALIDPLVVRLAEMDRVLQPWCGWLIGGVYELCFTDEDDLFLIRMMVDEG